ncbi:FkbM family methyltransferase [Polynucleobacter sp. HIN8]|uniref:FkbM family methyltransferase n=1 Tax=Polynucleobacter sp. HIN8 TaxID=3047867 RepID=UPI0025734645|nr:FkbM family methyltransferase [Polynucleobacter sp. HIN8]
MALKEILRAASRYLGYEISRYQTPMISPLLSLNIDLLIDIGANTGQTAIQARHDGYKNQILSFEPLLDAHKSLCKNSANDSRWYVFRRCALGSSPSISLINVAGNSGSSSILDMLPRHIKAAPESQYSSSQEVEVITLDSIFSEISKNHVNIFLKIDTQGYEHEVLAGSINALQKIKAVQLELSTTQLYASQYLYDYFFDFFKKNDYQLWGLTPGFSDPRTGELLQFDALFVRPDRFK